MSLPTFTHDPLPESTSHIRLLELIRGGFGEDVICKLSVWPFETAPPYNAISYTWGDPASRMTITVNDQRMLVTSNSHYALQQAFHAIANRGKPTRWLAHKKVQGPKKYLWLDAICIDQSNIREKNLQVALMGELYKRAEQVFACLGPHANDSEFLVSLCKRKQCLLQDIYSKVHIQASKMLTYGKTRDWLPTFKINIHTWLTFRSVLAIGPSNRMRLCLAFPHFIQRDYFKRVWILQELFMASNVVYCCGRHLLLSQDVLALDQLAHPWFITGDDHFCNNGWAEQAVRISRALVHIYNAPQSRRMSEQRRSKKPGFNTTMLSISKGCLLLASEVAGLYSLEDILFYVQYFQCAEVRDKIYGVLSLVKWPSNSRPIPDYETDLMELAVNVSIASSRTSQRTLGNREDFPCSAERVVQCLDLHPDHPAVQATITARSNTSVVTTGHSDADQIQYFTTCEDFHCVIRIQPSTSQGSSSGDLYCQEKDPNDTSVTLYDSSSRPFAIATLGTAAGDWYISPWSDSMVGMIVRTIEPSPAKHPKDSCTVGLDGLDTWRSSAFVLLSRGERLSIIGFAYRNSTEHEIFRVALLNVYWHPEDAIIFHMYHSYAKKGGIIRGLHDVRVCRSEGSSFVRVCPKLGEYENTGPNLKDLPTSKNRKLQYLRRRGYSQTYTY